MSLSEISLESKALTLLEQYEGYNNYILELQRKSQVNKKFYPTRSQSEYIINNHDKQPKVAKKWVILDAYFAQKLADDKMYTEIPQKVWVEKLLAEKDKAYHIWGKIWDSEQLHDFWLPKASIIKDNTVKDVVIDFEKYSNRPPLNHQKESIQKLVENKKYILADDMGLGKTTSTIIAALETGAKKVLIICPATLKINWKREIENYSDRTIYIAEGKNFSTEHDFVIINYDILKNFHDPKKKDWGPSRKTQIPGGGFVKIKKKCTKFPYCNQGDINNVKISKNESVKEAIKTVAKKLNIGENVIITILEHEYEKRSKRNK